MARSVKYIYSGYLIQQADKNPAVKGRASLTHNLIQSYGLLTHMERIRPIVCNASDLKAFHARDYIKQLDNYEEITKAKEKTLEDVLSKDVCTKDNEDRDEDEDEDDQQEQDCILSDCHGLSYDCPPWPGIKNYVCSIAGATMTACQVLCNARNRQDVILNWCGGWHHAQRGKAAGFCYVNDIVLGILVLTKKFPRILYVDLDNHHGDGVEMAFDSSKRVFCLSFHQWECGYYPGTGIVKDIGRDNGLGYSANFPYKRGITGDKYIKYFKRIFASVFDKFQPNVCVLQCGADVIVADPLGGSNLIPNDLIECINHVLSYETPCLLLGGGGYHFPNASRYWALLTAAVCGECLEEDIPADNEDFLRYGPDYCLNIERIQILKDSNTEEYLDEQASAIEENLKLFQVGAS